MDLGFVDVARPLESEAIEGGRAPNEFSFGPTDNQSEDDEPVLGRAVDDVQETDERLESVKRYVDYAQTAYQQRGLRYPFSVSPAGDSLDILPGQEDLARRSADLSDLVGKGSASAKAFEQRAFRTLHHFVGGWGCCVGHPRLSGFGPKRAVTSFRKDLRAYETGGHLPAFAPSGDLGLDGFVILGREWGGPVVFFQSKNKAFNFHDYPEEFARIRPILNDWFGRKLHRAVIPVLALNTVLTLEAKEQLFEAQNTHGYHVVDSVDILGAEMSTAPNFLGGTCHAL